jgi:hypothetical protein
MPIQNGWLVSMAATVQSGGQQQPITVYCSDYEAVCNVIKSAFPVTLSKASAISS